MSKVGTSRHLIFSGAGSGLPGSLLGQRIEGFDEDGAGFLEFRFAGCHQFPQEAFTFWRDAHKHETAVTFAAFAIDEPALLEAIDQFDGAVMTQTEPFRQVADRRLRSVRQSFQGQKEPILSWMKPGRPGRVVAQGKIEAKLIAEF